MRILFIGGGNMASALIGGLLQQGFRAADLRVAEISAEARSRLQSELGVATSATVDDAIGEEAVVLARSKQPDLPRQSPRKPPQAPGLVHLADRLSDLFDTRVKVEFGQRKGRIVVEFGSVDDLERIVQMMAPPAG